MGYLAIKMKTVKTVGKFRDEDRELPVKSKKVFKKEIHKDMRYAMI